MGERLKNEKLKKKILKEKIKLKREKRKIQKQKRKERKIKLIKLGTLFKILGLLNEPQETMLGYLENYMKLSFLDKNNLDIVGAKILSEREVENYDVNLEKRRQMFYLMIRKAALLEKLKIHLENPNVILGYLVKYKDLDEMQKKILYERGLELFNLKIKNKVDNKIASDEEKIRIIQALQMKKIDVTKYLKEKYNITIHNLRKAQYEEILRAENISLNDNR